MFELKENLYPDQKVSILEFTLLVNGIFEFNDFHNYTKQDLDLCNSFLKNELHKSYKYLKSTEVLDSKKVLPHLNRRNSVSKEDKESKLSRLNEVAKRSVFPNLLNRLESLTNEGKENIADMLDHLMKCERLNFNDFPTKGYGVKSLIDNTEYAFKMRDVMEWLRSNFNLQSNHGLPLTEWAKRLSSQHKTELQENDSTYDGYIKIDTLPKIMQFMIECYQDSSFQQSSMENNSKQVSIFKSEKVDKLFEISKQKDMTHTSNRKEQKGISPTALKYIIDFIQKD
jgi:hypothetical protein